MSTIAAEPKLWEEKYFGTNVYKLDINIDEEGYKNRYYSVKTRIKDLERSLNTGYEYSLINCYDIPVINAMESEGFRHLETTIELESDLLSSKCTTYITEVQPPDVPTLTEIARNSFFTGRLYAEYPRVNSHEMHAEWIYNCCTSTLADKVLVSRHKNIPTGFLALKSHGSAMDIILIAVDRGYRGSGIGKALINEAKMFAESSGCNKMIVRTELPNVAAIRLYEKCDFRTSGGGIYVGKWL